MEITNVMAVLNAMALINVDPSNTPKEVKQIPIKGVITCFTKAVIYLITCPCGKNYVGKTKRIVAPVGARTQRTVPSSSPLFGSKPLYFVPTLYPHGTRHPP